MGTMRTSCWKSSSSCGGGDGVDLGGARGGGQVDDLQFVLGAQVVEDGVEEEAIELRFGSG